MSNFVFNTDDFILYILNKLSPERVDDILKLNKIAFFVEFAYFFSKQKVLSEAKYAAITYGPAIDNYQKILKAMVDQGKINLDGFKVRPLKNPPVVPPQDIANFIDPLIEKYSQLTNDELIALSHQTDSWLITTNNNKVWGLLIDKELASLETLFVEDERNADVVQDDKILPKVDKRSLVKYEFD